MLECVINVSEGKNKQHLNDLTNSVANELLDVHTDPDHHRSVFTLTGEKAPRKLFTACTKFGDITAHTGVHPRIGLIDVVPFVPLGNTSMAEAQHARNSFAQWVASTYAVPCFLYGEEINGSSRTLPEIRRYAFSKLTPDFGPSMPHPQLGAIAVGARSILIAYNIWYTGLSLQQAQMIASSVRSPALRALGFEVSGGMQISMNLIAPDVCNPYDTFLLVEREAKKYGGSFLKTELVGLLPETILAAIEPTYWEILDIGETKTIEYRLAKAPIPWVTLPNEGT